MGRWVARTGTTPRRLRTWSLILGAGLLAIGGSSWALLSTRASATQRLRDHSAPLSIVTQRIASSLAESEATSTSAFRSGATEDKDQRRQYEDTLVRTASLLEDAAHLAGDDASTHATLARIQASVIQYAGLVLSLIHI